jgi:hypothetical protein
MCGHQRSNAREVTSMVQHATKPGQGFFPVDNNTYNLIQMTAAKLESLEVYQKYQKDADQQTRGLLESMIEEDRRHAERLVDALRRALNPR